MLIREIQTKRIVDLFRKDNGQVISEMGTAVLPHCKKIVDTFYSTLLSIPEPAVILENAIVEKNLRKSMAEWIMSLFSPRSRRDVIHLLNRQMTIGKIHANINVNIAFFNFGTTIIKEELFKILMNLKVERKRVFEYLRTITEILDLLTTLITESYFSNEKIHETNEISIRIKGLPQNVALECEKLRSLLLEWHRNILNSIFTSHGGAGKGIPKLKYSNFGLWVLYKADLISHAFDISQDLEGRIKKIDEALDRTLKSGKPGNKRFIASLEALNELVTETSCLSPVSLTKPWNSIREWIP